MIYSVLLLSLLQDSRPPEFVKFEVARERVGHKVVVDAALKNVAPAEIPGLKVTALFYDGEREIRRTPTVAVGKIAPGKAVGFKLEAEQVPNFSRYEIYVEGAAATRVYVGADPTKMPAPRGASAPKLVLVSQGGGQVVVRNTGESPADEPTAALTYGNGVFRVRLEKAIGPASEETFEVAVPGATGAPTGVTLAWQAADEISVPDADGRDVGVRQIRAARLTDGAARVSGTLVNPTAEPVERVSVRFRLGNKDALFELPGALKASESRPFVFYAPDCPAFDSVSFSLSFDSKGRGGGEAPALPSARRVSARAVEAGRVALPPPPKQVQEAAGPAEARPPSVGIRGLLVVEGYYGKGNKYTGDVYMMRMIFLDGQGKAFQPEATVNFTLYDGAKQVRKSQRSVTKESWRLEASKVNNQNVEMDTIAFDRKSGELWVAIHWTDGPFEKPRADLSVEIKDIGTYTLKGVQKDWSFAPQWPDK